MKQWVLKFLGRDWVDVGLHVAGGFGVMSVFGLFALDLWFGALFNAIAWGIREDYQAHQKGRSLNPLNWSMQKWLEWIAPAATGVLMAAMYGAP